MNKAFIYRSEDQDKNRDELQVIKTHDVIKQLKNEGYEVINFYNSKKN